MSGVVFDCLFQALGAHLICFLAFSGLLRAFIFLAISAFQNQSWLILGRLGTQDGGDQSRTETESNFNNFGANLDAILGSRIEVESNYVLVCSLRGIEIQNDRFCSPSHGSVRVRIRSGLRSSRSRVIWLFLVCFQVRGGSQGGPGPYT